MCGRRRRGARCSRRSDRAAAAEKETDVSGHRDHELHRRRLGRNLAVGGALLALVLLIFAVTMVKLGQTGVNLS